MSADRVLAYLWGGGLVLLSLWPAVREPRVDSYPLSTYPMFSSERGQPLIHQVVFVDRAGQRVPLPPRLVANGETLQAAASIERAADEGRAALWTLCRKVAEQVRLEDEFTSARSIEIRSVRYDPIGYFEHGKQPLESKRLERCRVPRP